MWHYQARRRTDHGEQYYEVIEVYRESVCGPAGRTVDGVLAGGGTKAELIADLERMLSDVKRYRTIVEKETPCTDRDRQWAKEKAVIACEHIMHIKQVSGSANETATAICSKCGYEPYP